MPTWLFPAIGQGRLLAGGFYHSKGSLAVGPLHPYQVGGTSRKGTKPLFVSFSGRKRAWRRYQSRDSDQAQPSFRVVRVPTPLQPSRPKMTPRRAEKPPDRTGGVDQCKWREGYWMISHAFLDADREFVSSSQCHNSPYPGRALRSGRGAVTPSPARDVCSWPRHQRIPRKECGVSGMKHKSLGPVVLSVDQ